MSTPYDSLWFVTNGLLARELMTGQVQLGNTSFEAHDPSQAQVAGDPRHVRSKLRHLRHGHGRLRNQGRHDADRDVGSLRQCRRASGAGRHGVTAAQQVAETDHTVASVFWDFMNSPWHGLRQRSVC